MWEKNTKRIEIFFCRQKKCGMKIKINPLKHANDLNWFHSSLLVFNSLSVYCDYVRTIINAASARIHTQIFIEAAGSRESIIDWNHLKPSFFCMKMKENWVVLFIYEKWGWKAYFNKCQIHTILKSSSEGLNNKHSDFFRAFNHLLEYTHSK